MHNKTKHKIIGARTIAGNQLNAMEIYFPKTSTIFELPKSFEDPTINFIESREKRKLHELAQILIEDISKNSINK